MHSLNHEYEDSDWKILRDLNKFKASLFHNRSKKLIVIMAYNKTKNYESTKHLLGRIDYDNQKWHICENIKAVGRFFGLLLGYIGTSVFYALRNSRANKQCYL